MGSLSLNWIFSNSCYNCWAWDSFMGSTPTCMLFTTSHTSLTVFLLSSITHVTPDIERRRASIACQSWAHFTSMASIDDLPCLYGFIVALHRHGPLQIIREGEHQPHEWALLHAARHSAQRLVVTHLHRCWSHAWDYQFILWWFLWCDRRAFIEYTLSSDTSCWHRLPECATRRWSTT